MINCQFNQEEDCKNPQIIKKSIKKRINTSVLTVLLYAIFNFAPIGDKLLENVNIENVEVEFSININNTCFY